VTLRAAGGVKPSGILSEPVLPPLDGAAGALWHVAQSRNKSKNTIFFMVGTEKFMIGFVKAKFNVRLRNGCSYRLCPLVL
jgi:hypothetical protein